MQFITELMDTILIVEDDESYRSMLMYALESQGYKVFVAPGGLEAKNILQKLIPDLIITDIIMEDMDGFEVIIHAKKQNPEIKIIAISGGGQLRTERYLDTAKELGAEYSIISNLIFEIAIGRQTQEALTQKDMLTPAHRFY